jgi:hypothetical protein
MPADLCTDELHYDVPPVLRRWGFWMEGIGVQWMLGVHPPAVKGKSIGVAVVPLPRSRPQTR